MASSGARAAARRAAVPAGERHVVVLGGGVVGCSAAYQLARRGARVTLVEREEVAASSSGKAGGFLARDWGDDVTRALHVKSFELHEELAEELGIDSWRPISTLSVGRGAPPAGGGDSSTPVPAPWLDGPGVRQQLMDENTAQVTPRELTTKLADAAARHGAEVVVGKATGVVGGEPAEGAPVGARAAQAVKLEVGGEERELECSDVIVAMGVWSTLAAPWFGLDESDWPLAGIRSSHAIWEGREAVRRDPFALFCQEDENGCHLEVYPRSNGDLYVCGIGSSEHVDDIDRLREGGDCGSASAVAPNLERVAAASRSLEALTREGQGEPDVIGACLRPCAPDARPLMGQIEGWDNAFLAAGHNCWGILWGPISGKVMAELLLEGDASIDLSAFAPGRFMRRRPRRGRQRGSEAVGEQW